jgi:predicted AAA+ superfamily ATPase
MVYYERYLQTSICEALTLVPIVFLNGPRQAGKNTLARHLATAPLDADYTTFDDISTFAAASADPEGFLRGFAKPLIVDEVQMVPDVFRVIKSLADEYRLRDKAHANGRFLLTGSANVLALPGLADALVGRMAVLTLYPFSAGEALGRGKPVINGLFDQHLASGNDNADGKRYTLEEIVNRATFPEISGARSTDATLWFNGYISTLLQRDVRQLAEIEKVSALPNILNALAARTGGLLNDADCARDAKLNAMTYRRYRVLIQQLFLIALVPPWSRNIGKRFVKSPKVYFTDTALLCHQLGVELGTLPQRNPGLYGRIAENFVASELMKQIAMLQDGVLYHFRTQDNREVDFVIERRSGALIGIEVKARESVTAEDFAGLKVLKELAGKDFTRGIVLYMGRETIAFADDMLAVPLETLWTLNMDVTAEKDIHQIGWDHVFWADYGDSTRVRCFIEKETIDDYFHNHATKQQTLEAIRKHWKVIWPILERKILDGQIKFVHHDRGLQMIRQVTLIPQDFGYKDFRERA